MKAEINVVYKGSDAIIFESSFRNYPSLAIQGDTLFLLATRLHEVREMVVRGQIDEECLDLLEEVDGTLGHLNALYLRYGDRPSPNDSITS